MEMESARSLTEVGVQWTIVGVQKTCLGQCGLGSPSSLDSLEVRSLGFVERKINSLSPLDI